MMDIAIWVKDKYHNGLAESTYINLHSIFLCKKKLPTLKIKTFA